MIGIREALREQHQELVRTVAERDRLRPDAEPPRQGILQGASAWVGISMGACRRRAHRGNGTRGRAEWILV